MHAISIRVRGMAALAVAFVRRAVGGPSHRAVVGDQANAARVDLVAHAAGRIAQGTVNGVDPIRDGRIGTRDAHLEGDARSAEVLAEDVVATFASAGPRAAAAGIAEDLQRSSLSI